MKVGGFPRHNGAENHATQPFLDSDTRYSARQNSTGRMRWMADRKWKEINLQPGTAGPGNMLGCCLIYFHFMWAILCPQAVDQHRIRYQHRCISYLQYLDNCLIYDEEKGLWHTKHTYKLPRSLAFSASTNLANGDWIVAGGETYDKSEGRWGLGLN